MPPEMISMGMPSRPASPMPLAAWVTPAAGTMTRVPMLSLVRLTASAMKAAPHSWVTRTGWMLSDEFNSSYSSVLCTPGMPKVYLTPNCSRAKRASAAPVFFMSCSFSLFFLSDFSESGSPSVTDTLCVAFDTCDGPGRAASVEDAVAQEGSLQGAYSADAAAANAGSFATRVQAGNGLPLAVQHP